MNSLLKLSIGNGKLERDTLVIYLPAGWTCPGASLCLSKASRETGKVTDGPDTQFRCFAASDERYSQAREAHWYNLDMIKATLRTGVAKTTALIVASIDAVRTRNTKRVRIHASGDFFSLSYLKAWIGAARARPDLVFYCYTKSGEHFDRIDSFPPNFRWVFSLGSKFDELAVLRGWRTAEVVLSEKEAEDKGLPIDHDDSHAYGSTQRFALLIHGTQPSGTAAAKAIQVLRKAGEYGYGKAADKKREGKRVPLPTV